MPPVPEMAQEQRWASSPQTCARSQCHSRTYILTRDLLPVQASVTGSSSTVQQQCVCTNACVYVREYVKCVHVLHICTVSTSWLCLPPLLLQAFLTRVATHIPGTRELLAANLLLHLSECKFIGMRPSRDEVAMDASSRGPSISTRVAGQPSVMEYGGFVPSVMERYHQLLFPVLRLMSSLLTNSGPAYREVAVQVGR